MRRQAIVLAGVYVAGSGLSALVAADPTDLDAFFLPSAREALSGHPLHVYAVRHDTLYPNANGPLSLAPLTAVAAAATRLGWIDDPRLRRILVMAAFSLFALLLAREAVLAIDRARGVRTGGRPRVVLYAAFAAPPLIWHSVLLYGHIEQPICLWLVLCAVRAVGARRTAAAGVLIGLAALDRSVALLYIVALVPMLLRDQDRRAALRFTAAAGATIAVGMAPFLVADRADTVFSLVTFHGALPVGGGSIWQLAVGTPLEAVAQHLDGVAVIVAAGAAATLVVWRRGHPTAGGRAGYGVLALVALCFPLMVKTVWPYYFLDAYVLATVWALGRPGGRRWRTMVLPAVISGCAPLAELGVEASTGPSLRRAESAAMFVVLAITAVSLARALIRDYGTAVGSAVPLGAGGAEGAAAVGSGAPDGSDTPDGSGAPEGGGDTGAEVGPSGGVGQLARATLNGVGDGLGVGDVPAGGAT